MNFRNLIALAVFVMALVFCAPCGWAQSSGNLQGTVKDASGGILVGATVGITDPATGYLTMSGGKLQIVGGTSASAPLWASLIARINASIGKRVGNINALLYSKIAYVPKSTQVDSPIDHALESRRGVCQDFAHIMIGLTRRIGIPCRYVSGYLFHKEGERSKEGATHAWVETLLPTLGWVGFDPTNNVIVGDRHVRTSVGRDYADVPPTKGVFKGSAESQLLVAVHVAPSDAPPIEPEVGAEDWSQALREEAATESELTHQQQQQQQQ